jgi:hypothetical protein
MSSASPCAPPMLSSHRPNTSNVRSEPQLAATRTPRENGTHTVLHVWGFKRPHHRHPAHGSDGTQEPWVAPADPAGAVVVVAVGVVAAGLVEV